MARTNKNIGQVLPKTVSEVGKIAISGNVVPPVWFKTITFDSGKPDLNSILLLADILYWYRPTEVRNEHSGAVTGYRKKFHEDLLRRSYADFEAQFGFSKKQCQECLRRLENLGVIRRVFRTLHSTAGRLNNVMYIELVPSVVQQLTAMPQEATEFSGNSTPMEDDVPPYGDQSNQGGPSGSIGGDVEIPPYGDQAPHHIKDTNITADTSSNNSSLSQRGRAPGQTNMENERETIPERMLEIWNELIPEKKILSPNEFLTQRLMLALKDQLNGNMGHWKVACENFCSSKFLMGESEKIQMNPSLSWLLDPKEPRVDWVHSKAHYTFDDRMKKARKTLSTDSAQSLIESSDECPISKRLRHFVLKQDPNFYIAYFLQASIEVSDACVHIQSSTGFASLKIKEVFETPLKEWLQKSYQLDLEVMGGMS